MENKRYNVHLPPLRDNASTYSYLGKICEAILSAPHNSYIFDFSGCSTISHNGLVVIGGICNYLKQQNSSRSLLSPSVLSFLSPPKVGFNIDNINPVLMEKLLLIGFWNYVQPAYGVVASNDYIGYREHEKVIEDSEIISHLKDSWLTSEKLHMSESLKAEIVSSIYEIFVNAYGHGLKDNEFGQSVISCGSYDAKAKELSLSVFDLGGGIVESVRNHDNQIASDRDAFEWALEFGNSTRTDSTPDLPRGLGFGILKDFVHLNGGRLRICSDSYSATVDDNGEYLIESIGGRFQGTLVSISVKCDNNYYKFKSESPDESTPNYF
ncbi:hypothetical protein P0Y67_21710 [Photobacterium sp. SP02]|uniref:hypothetical protein n=1 Tax=Photobacterium sp. SP02 TaxID=3032280 RepID=UPI00314501FD